MYLQFRNARNKELPVNHSIRRVKRRLVRGVCDLISRRNRSARFKRELWDGISDGNFIWQLINTLFSATLDADCRDRHNLWNPSSFSRSLRWVSRDLIYFRMDAEKIFFNENNASNREWYWNLIKILFYLQHIQFDMIYYTRVKSKFTFNT